MAPRLRLMLLAGTVAATLSLAMPALADGTSGSVATSAKSHSLRTQSESVPGEQQPPPPAPNGCPFRDGKLELMV